MAYYKPVKSIHRVSLCSLPLTLTQQILFLFKNAVFMAVFLSQKYMLVQSTCWFQILDEEILLNNWFTVSYLFVTRAIFFNYPTQLKLLCSSQCLEWYYFIMI